MIWTILTPKNHRRRRQAAYAKAKLSLRDQIAAVRKLMHDAK
jgi:hypothetical protein